MKRARIGLMAAAALAVTTMAFAQAKPDFSGTWTLDPAASQMGGGAAAGGGRQGGGRGMGGPMTVKQTADTLTVERTMGDNTITQTYKLDGSESKNTMMGRGGESMEQVSMAKWDGNKLVITTKTANGEQVQTWSLEHGNLTIDRTGGRGATKQVYKKTT